VSQAPLPGAAATHPSLATRPSETLLDPDLIEAARILHAALVRVHPSFRFEERLANRLDAAAARARLDAEGGAERLDDPIRFPRAIAVDGVPEASRSAPWRAPALAVVAARVPRGALLGGAIASGVSLAGAAILAQRWRSRPSRSVFARAARAAHRTAQRSANGSRPRPGPAARQGVA